MESFDRIVNLLTEMSIKEIENKDVLNLIRQKKYMDAVKKYVELGGVLGARAKPKITTAAIKKKVLAQDPKYEGIDSSMIKDFEDVLIQMDTTAKQEETGVAKKAIASEPAPVPASAEKASSGPKVSSKEEADPDLVHYLSTFKKEILDRFKKDIIDDYVKNKTVIPMEYRDDADWIETSFKVVSPNDTHSKRFSDKLDAIASRNAKKAAKEKEEKKTTKGEEYRQTSYDEFGYSKEIKQETKIKIKNLIKETKSIVFKTYDSPEEEAKKKNALIHLAEQILAQRKIFIDRVISDPGSDNPRAIAIKKEISKIKHHIETNDVTDAVMKTSLEKIEALKKELKGLTKSPMVDEAKKQIADLRFELEFGELTSEQRTKIEQDIKKITSSLDAARASDGKSTIWKKLPGGSGNPFFELASAVEKYKKNGDWTDIKRIFSGMRSGQGADTVSVDNEINVSRSMLKKIKEAKSMAELHPIINTIFDELDMSVSIPKSLIEKARVKLESNNDIDKLIFLKKNGEFNPEYLKRFNAVMETYGKTSEVKTFIRKLMLMISGQFGAVDIEAVKKELIANIASGTKNLIELKNVGTGSQTKAVNGLRSDMDTWNSEVAKIKEDIQKKWKTL